jgi:large subunit ribosomal protein L17
MRHLRQGRKLGVKSKHRKALMRNLAKNMVHYKRIRTTVTRAKEASSFIDRLVQLAKRNDLHARRLLVAELGCAATADVLIRQIAPHFKNRNGGYTRILKLGISRPGDAAELALLEFTELIELPKKKEKKPKKAKAEVQTDVTAEPAKVSDKKKKDAPAKEKAESGKEEKKSDEKKPQDKGETEKKGGFLGKLRKFLKGDE